MLYQELKRKNDTADYEAESCDRAAGPRYAEVLNNSLQTPVSMKVGKGNKTSRLTKCNKSGPQTPILNVGKALTFLFFKYVAYRGINGNNKLVNATKFFHFRR